MPVADYYNGKNVLITGAAGGIGRLLAERIGELGGRLILWDVDEVRLRALEGEFRADGIPVAVYGCDMADRAQVKSTIERTLKQQGRVDILINNAGIVNGRRLLDLSEEDIRRTMEVNALALYWTTRAFLPGMIEHGGGHIVTVASAAGLSGTAMLTDYCGSKFAAVGFDESLRMELARDRVPIHTTVVCPFYVDTGMFAGVRSRVPFLLPILKSGYVAERIVRAVAKRKKRLLMPRFLHAVFLARLLPVSWFDAIQSVLGTSTSMDHFQGRG